MILKYSSLIGSLVAELKDQTRLGKLTEMVIDNEKISIAALVVEQPFWFFTKNKFVLSMDIVYLIKNGAIVKDDESLVDLSESISVEKLVKGKSYGVGQKVVTDSGEQLGHVYDFLIDNENLSIVKFYVKQLAHDRIIPVDKVLSMTGQVITIKSNYASGRISAVPMPETITAC